MKGIIIGTSCSGKTTTVRCLRESHALNIGEMDEELVSINGGSYPEDAEKKHKVLAPRIIKQILQSADILFFTNAHYFWDQDLINARELGFKIIQLDLSIGELKKRNANRVADAGYEDVACWLDDMIEYQEHISQRGFVDKKIDATRPTPMIVKELLEYFSQ